MTAPDPGAGPAHALTPAPTREALLNFLRDLAERVVATFVAGFLGAVSLDLTSITSLGWKAWLIAGAGAGVVSVAKGLAARFIGNNGSASLDPKNVG